VNRYLKQWGLDRGTLMRQPPAVRFQARYSNQCWQFDLSPSDMKQLPAPPWLDAGRGALQLMLYSVVDDRSGVAYQEYHCVYGEDVEAALRFLFNAMAPKAIDGFPFEGIPEMLYVDSGPITKSLIFQHVMSYLGIEVRPHMPQGSDGRRPTARAKGKVERPFRTVKEMHETLYHFHVPETELEANAWLLNFLLRYNHMQHRTEPHSRFEDWLDNLPPTGIRKMCGWERFCTFAREPERRKVGVDARVSAEGTMYAVDPELAGETVVLWWGLFDNELYVEHGEERFGPYHPIGGPIPLHRYRRFKKSKLQQRADRIEALAAQLHLSRKALEDRPDVLAPLPGASLSSQPFVDPDPFHEITFPSVIDAKRAIASYLGQPLAKLPPEQLDYINALVGETLQKQEVMARVRDYFKTIRGKSPC
ncbi:MAG TPA: IS481 family transposase, partial [Gammaproteobacteria bacterium]|nr:IS481 family transposase [Gammaproteobacteria bacterium]